jgi:hypothetical protein
MGFIKNKKGDINLSFGMIFSIILIAVFIFAAIYGINFFLNYGKCTQVGRFYDDFQRQVSTVFLSQFTENKNFDVLLPSSIKMICFANLSENQRGDFIEEYNSISDYYLDDANLFLIPGESACSIPYKNIKRLNIQEIIKDHNPYCIYPNEDLLLTKKIYESSVFVKKG